MHTDNQKKVLVLGEGLTQGLDDPLIKAEAKYSINFTESGKRFALCPHYNESKSFLFVNAKIIHQSKSKDSEIKPYPLCLRNISKMFRANNMKNTRLNGSKIFPLIIILLILVILWIFIFYEKTWYKTFEFIKIEFIIIYYIFK